MIKELNLDPSNRAKIEAAITEEVGMLILIAD
jgi:hypothetical protein